MQQASGKDDDAGITSSTDDDRCIREAAVGTGNWRTEGTNGGQREPEQNARNRKRAEGTNRGQR